MNLTGRGMDPHEKMKRIGAMARRKAGADSEYRPIRLSILNRQRQSFMTTACDSFKLSQNVSDMGLTSWDLSIIRMTEARFSEALNFVRDPDTMDLYHFIPWTEDNIRWLASHLEDEIWEIDDAQALEEAKKIAATMPKIRDVQAEKQQIGYQHVAAVQKDAEIDRLRREIQALKGTQIATGQTTPQTEDEQESLEDSACPSLNAKEEETEASSPTVYSQEVKAEAKQRLENEGLLTELKKNKRAWHLSTEYRTLLAEKCEEVLRDMAPAAIDE